MAMKKMSNNEQAMWFAIIGGILMLVAGVTGAAAWGAIGEAIGEFTDSDGIKLVFSTLVLLGSLGGIMVMFGALMFKEKKQVKIGKLVITIGAGFGLFGLIILTVLSVLNGDYLFFTGIGVGFVGLILSIVARQKVKP